MHANCLRTEFDGAIFRTHFVRLPPSVCRDHGCGKDQESERTGRGLLVVAGQPAGAGYPFGPGI